MDPKKPWNLVELRRKAAQPQLVAVWFHRFSGHTPVFQWVLNVRMFHQAENNIFKNRNLNPILIMQKKIQKT